MEYKKILIILPNWLGDMVMCLPSIQTVKRHFPDARISAIGRDGFSELLKLFPAVDEYIAWGETGRGKRIKNASNIIKEKNFELAIVFPNSFSSALVPFISSIPKRLGYA
ncbi:MAG: glycosyltransferase family 9 protein, partial [Candidatus Omnitrophica bacterium]|nr:glycosyltransferase family 9 protein [Candidatus Omnitrophota bacterium]